MLQRRAAFTPQGRWSKGAPDLECGDLSPLSRGDLSPSEVGAREDAKGAFAARASGGVLA